MLIMAAGDNHHGHSRPRWYHATSTAEEAALRPVLLLKAHAAADGRLDEWTIEKREERRENENAVIESARKTLASAVAKSSITRQFNSVEYGLSECGALGMIAAMSGRALCPRIQSC